MSEDINVLENRLNQASESLKNIGVEVYLESVNNLLAHILYNAKEEIEKDRTFCSACQAGHDRSFVFDNLLKKLGFNVSEIRASKRTPGQRGFDVVSLGLAVAGGKLGEKGGLIPENFDPEKEVNTLVIFQDEENFNTQFVNKVLSRMFENVAATSGKNFDNLQIFVVPVNEFKVSDLSTKIQSMFDEGNTYEDIARAIYVPDRPR